MKFVEPTRNPMGDILELFPYEWVIITPIMVETFRVLLVEAGYISEDIWETSRCLDILEELDLVEIKTEDNEYKIRKIKHG